MKSKSYPKKISLRILVIAIIAELLLGCVVAYAGYFTYTRDIKQKYMDYASTLLTFAQNQIDGDQLNASIQQGKENAYYDSCRDLLSKIKESADISYIYAVYFQKTPDSQQMCYVVNGVTSQQLKENRPEDVYSYLGEQCQEGDFDKAMEQSFYDEYTSEDQKEGTIQYIINDTTEYGYQLTSYVPISNSNGDKVCILAIDLSMNRIKEIMKNYVTTVALITILILIISLAAFVGLIRYSVITPVKALAESSDDFISQTKSVEDTEQLNFRKIQPPFQDEIAMLSDNLYEMTEQMKNYMSDLKTITAEKERIGAELSVATHIQASMLPCIFPAFPQKDEFDIYASMNPAKEVGGDFYDFFLIDEDHLGLVMADVSGKGVPAALFMVISKTLLKNYAQMSHSPQQILEIVNNQLCEGNEAEMFVTVWLGIYEISTGIMKAASAGHEYPAIKRAEGSFELFKDKHGFVLAGMEGAKYKEYELQFDVGDMLFVYTDGVAEATSAENELFGVERMIAALNEHPQSSPEELLTDVHNAIDLFVGDAPQFDDITMMAIKINSKG